MHILRGSPVFRNLFFALFFFVGWFPPPSTIADDSGCPCGDGNTPVFGCCGGDGQRPCVTSSDSIFSDCRNTCLEGNVQTATTFCATPREGGESCGPAFPCKDGYTCWPGNFTCYPDTDAKAIPASECRKLYSAKLHQQVMNYQQSGLALIPNTTLRPGQALGLGLGDTTVVLGKINNTESGVIYGTDGSFGCYLTTCTGAAGELASAATYASATQYVSYEAAAGSSQVLTSGVEFGVQIGAGWVLSDTAVCSGDVGSILEADVIGRTGYVGLNLGVSPFDLGACASCTTSVNTVIPAKSPIASCAEIFNFDQFCRVPPGATAGTCSKDGKACSSNSDCKPINDQFVFCADPVTCSADINVDTGSFALHGRTISNRAQYPSGPYPFIVYEPLSLPGFPKLRGIETVLAASAVRPITLTVTDSAGDSASCDAHVVVKDCQPPPMDCPEPLIAECEGLVGAESGGPGYRGAVVLPPSADGSRGRCGDRVSTLQPPKLTYSALTGKEGEQPFPLGTTWLPYSIEDNNNIAICAPLPEDFQKDRRFDYYVVGESAVKVVDTNPPAVSCPADVTVECQGLQGASASFGAATAADVCEGAQSASCDHQSGQSFAVGTTRVTCSASDSSENTGSCGFNVKVADTKPPAITCPSDIVQECTGNSGARVTYVTGAQDACSATVTTTCDQSSGSIFSLGTNAVSCSAKDASGNTSACSMNVTVKDTKPPSLAAIGNVAPIECGIGTFSDPGARVYDTCDANVNNTTVQATGSVDVFTVGTYPVQYGVTDASGNAAKTLERLVSVVDTTAPSISCPPDITVEPVSPVGTAVTFSAQSWSDACDRNLPEPSCPLSGSTFPVGTTTNVQCSVTDATGGLTSSCSLQIKVLSEQEVVQGLQNKVDALADAINRGQENALGERLANLLQALERDPGDSTCGQVTGLIAQVEGWRSGGVLSDEEAATLLSSAHNLKATFSCSI